MEYFLKPSALKDLRKLPKNIQQRIISKLDFYIVAPHPLDFAEKLTDHYGGNGAFALANIVSSVISAMIRLSF